MARVELPPSALRARRRRRRLWFFSLLCGAAMLVVVAGVAAMHAAVVRVSVVEVAGAQTIASSTLEARVRELLEGNYLWVVPRNSIFAYPKHAIVSELAKTYPTFASVSVHAVDFHTIAVTVVERAPRALWCKEQGCYFMDETGTVYAPAPSFSSPVYTQYYGAVAGETLPRQYLTPERFAALTALVDAVVQKLPQEQLEGVLVDKDEDAQMRFAGDFSIKFSLRDQGGDVFERLVLALGSETVQAHTLKDFEYLDLRFGDKLYYKLR